MTLSVQNNNPGNMQQNGTFATYPSPEAGLQAMQHDLLLKISGNSQAMKSNYGEGYQPTLRNIISTWAPNNENNTANYINFVSSNSGLHPDQPLSANDINKIIPPMVHMEGGQQATQYFKQYAQNNTQANDAPPESQPTKLNLDQQKALVLARVRLRLKDQQPQDQRNQPSTTEDVIKSVGSNLVEGAVAMPMILPNLMNQAVAGPQELYRGLTGREHDNSPMWQPFNSSSDVVKAMSLDYQPQSPYGAAAAIPSQLIGNIASGSAIQNSPNMINSAIQSFKKLPTDIEKTFGINQNSSVAVPENIKQNLLQGNPDLRIYSGENLGQKLSGAEQAAQTEKNLAYQKAEPALEKATLPATNANDLSSLLKNHTSQYDSDLVPAVKLINRYADEINTPIKLQGGNEDIPAQTPEPKPITLDKIELLRKKLNNIPVSDTATGKLVSGAKGIIDNKMNEFLQNGIVEGNPDALNLIKEARTKNTYWRQKFTGDEANTAIKTFIENQGGPNEIAPENLLDMFTRVGQTGLDNVKAAKDILGKDADPLLKNGFLDKIRNSSLKNGNINPKALSTQINTIMTKNPTLIDEVFSSDEQNALRAIQREALSYANGEKGKPSLLNKIASKTPAFGPLIEEALKNRSQEKMVKDLSNPKITITPSDKLPMPKINLPQVNP